MHAEHDIEAQELFRVPPVVREPELSIALAPDDLTVTPADPWGAAGAALLLAGLATLVTALFPGPAGDDSALLPDRSGTALR